MMLQEVLQSAIDRHLLTDARVGPMRTAVKQFSAMFGVPPDELTPKQYHLSKEPLFRFIEQHSADDVGPRKLANTKNNIRWLLDLAIREGWLRPSASDPITWKNRRRTHHLSLYRQWTDGSHATPKLYGLLLPVAEDNALTEPNNPTRSGYKGGLQRYRIGQQQGLQVAPPAFLQEIDAYLSWCQRTYAPNRDAKVKKRAITADKCRCALLRVGGYAHHIAGIPLEQLSLDLLTQPAFVGQFVDWWVNERRGRVTVTIQKDVRCLKVVARHWLKLEERAIALKAIELSLSNDQGPVWDKEQSLVPLRTIEEAGLKTYPFTIERLQRSRTLRALYAHVKDTNHEHIPGAWITERVGTGNGTEVMMSLIIRLLVRLPMRQRCIREMRLGHNLKQLPDGNWEVHFKGLELKISSRKTTGLNEYHHPVPADLTSLINEWLTFWRPRRVPEKGSDLVFLNETGRQFALGSLNTLFIGAVYRFTGIRTSIHMVRDSWASDYLDATGDVSGCADMLGDTVPVVLQHYAHVLKRRAQGRTANWLQTHLAAAD